MLEGANRPLINQSRTLLPAGIGASKQPDSSDEVTRTTTSSRGCVGHAGFNVERFELLFVPFAKLAAERIRGDDTDEAFRSGISPFAETVSSAGDHQGGEEGGKQSLHYRFHH